MDFHLHFSETALKVMIFGLASLIIHLKGRK